MNTQLQKEKKATNYNVCLKDTVEVFTKRLFYSLFDDKQRVEHAEFLGDAFLRIAAKLAIKFPNDIWNTYKTRFSDIREKLDLDARAIAENDPAATSLEEVYLAYPGFHAIAIYRLSHELYLLDVPIIPRMMSEYVHGLTGIDIHPGAKIGDAFFIDHGTGIVIGETSIIKNRVKIYQGVTLGGIQVRKDLSSTKRHPTIENDVTIYANATILGGDIIIGAHSIIGANVWITKSVPENSLVTNRLENKVTLQKK